MSFFTFQTSRHLQHISRIVFSALVLLLVSLHLVNAQEGDLIETFDDPSLPGWESSPGVTVVASALRVEPENFAAHGGEWGQPMLLSVRVRRSGGPGELVIAYCASGDRAYRVVIGSDLLLFQRATSGSIEELTAAPLAIPFGDWFQLDMTITGDEHTAALDGELAFTAFDPDPLPPGGIAFEAHGDTTGEFDDLTLSVRGEAQPADAEPTPVPPTTGPGSEPPSADALGWVRTGGPPGGLGYDIRYNFADPDIWYATDAWGGLHISTDNGLTWQESSSGIPGQAGPTGDAIPIFCLTVDPHDPQIVWAGTDRTGHIYKSTDGGRTWEQRDNGVSIEYDALSFRGFTVDPRSSDIVYAMGETIYEELGGATPWRGGVGGVVYRTTDGGANWEVIWDGGMPSSLARYLWIDSRDPDVLYVSTGIFDRSAAGESNSIENPFGGLGVLKSTDGGQTWRILNEDNGLRSLYIGSLFMHPEDPDVLLAAAGHVFEPDTLPYTQRLIDEGQPSPTGIYRTIDGGEDWTQTLADFEVFSSVELCPSDPDIGYASSPDSFYRSEDSGGTWTLIASPWGPSGVQVGFPIDMQCDPRDPNRIFVNNYGGGNFLSEDGGRTWRNASQGYTGERAFSVAVDPNDPARVYSAGFGGAWRSDNGGTTWNGLYHPLPDFPVGFETVAADPSRSGHVLAGDVGIFESFDSGESWALRWSLEQVAAELPEDAVADQTPSAIVFAPSDPQTVYVGFGPQGCVNGHEPACWRPGAGVVVSRDGGASWRHPMSEALHGLCVIDLAVDSNDDEIIFAATGIGLFKSTDAGENWTALPGLPQDTPVRAVAVSPADSQHIVAGIDGVGVYISHDGGSTWQEGVAGLEPNGSLDDIVFDPVNPQEVYTSDQASGVYRSLDGGQSWARINSGLRSRAAMGLAVSRDGQHLYVGTFGDGVYRLDLNGVPPQPTEQAVEQPTSVPEPGQTVEPPKAEPLAPEPEPIEQVVEEPTSVPEPGQTIEPPEAESLAPEPEPGVHPGVLYLGGALLVVAVAVLIWLRYRRR